MNKADCYWPEGGAHTCWKCGCTEIKHVTWSTLAVLDNGTGPELEFEERCGSCGESLAYWAYGYYDPAYMADEL